MSHIKQGPSSARNVRPSLGDNRRARWRAKQDIAIVFAKEWARVRAAKFATGLLAKDEADLYRAVKDLERSEGHL